MITATSNRMRCDTGSKFRLCLSLRASNRSDPGLYEASEFVKHGGWLVALCIMYTQQVSSYILRWKFDCPSSWNATCYIRFLSKVRASLKFQNIQYFICYWQEAATWSRKTAQRKQVGNKDTTCYNAMRGWMIITSTTLFKGQVQKTTSGG